MEEVQYFGGPADGKVVSDNRQLPEYYEPLLKRNKVIGYAVYARELETKDAKGRAVYKYTGIRLDD